MQLLEDRVQVGERVNRQQFAERGRLQAPQGLQGEGNALSAAQVLDDGGDLRREERGIARQRQILDGNAGGRHAQQAQPGRPVAAQHAIERRPDGNAQCIGGIAGLLQFVRQPVAHEPRQALRQRRPLRRLQQCNLFGIQAGADECIRRPRQQMAARRAFECRIDGIVDLPASGSPELAGELPAARLCHVGHQADQDLVWHHTRRQSGGTQHQHGRWVGEQRDDQIRRARAAGRHQRQQPLVVDLRLRQRLQVFGKLRIRDGLTTERHHPPVTLIMAEEGDLREDAPRGRAVFFPWGRHGHGQAVVGWAGRHSHGAAGIRNGDSKSILRAGFPMGPRPWPARAGIGFAISRQIFLERLF